MQHEVTVFQMPVTKKTENENISINSLAKLGKNNTQKNLLALG